VKSMVR